MNAKTEEARCKKMGDACLLEAGHDGSCGSDECDECDGSGVFYLDGVEQPCACMEAET